MVLEVIEKQCAAVRRIKPVMRNCVFSSGLENKFGSYVTTSVKVQPSSTKVRHNIMSRQLKTQVDMFEWISGLHDVEEIQ
jgi:hypothetical protein